MTRLQEQVEQLSKLLTDKISREIADGAEVRTYSKNMIDVDGVTVHKTDRGAPFLLIEVPSEEINGIFKPSRDELNKRKMELQNELNQINKQINEL